MNSIQKAKEFKDLGNDFFKSNNYTKAKSNYGKGLAYVKGMRGSKRAVAPELDMIAQSAPSDYLPLAEEIDEEAKQLEIVLHQNIAICFLRMDKPEEALSHCESALRLDPKSPKALLRKGQALIALKRYEKAREVLTNALKENQADPELNKAIQKSLRAIHEVMKKEEEEDKKRYLGILSR